MSSYHQQPEIRELLAGEYVLGSLTGAARRRFETLMREDERVERAVRDWERRFDPLAARVAISPRLPTRVWSGIEARVAPRSRTRATTGSSTLLSGLWSDLLFWRAFGMGALVLAVVINVIGIPQPQKTPITAIPTRVAVIDQDREPAWVVRHDGPTLRIKNITPMDMPSDKVCALWLHWDEGQMSQPIGILPDAGEATIPIPDELMGVLNRAKLRVTVESRQTFVREHAIESAPPNSSSNPVVAEGRWVDL